MSDTRIDAPPPTIRDESLAPSMATPPSRPTRPSRRSARGGKLAIAGAILGVALLAGGVALYLYLTIARFQPLARRHIPGNANLVSRLQLADIALFGPVREHLWPLLLAPSSRAGPAPGKSRVERIHEATGVNLATEAREIVIATVDGSAWAVVVGGMFKPGGFVKGLAKIAREDGWAGAWRIEGELLLGPGSIAIGQADDGTLAFGTTADIVAACLPASDEFTRLELPDHVAAAFAVSNAAWSGAAGASAVAHAGVLRRIDRATGELDLGSAPRLHMELVPEAGTDAPTLARDLDALLADLRLVTMILPDLAGEKGALAAATVTVKAARVSVEAPWSYDALDRACARLAGVLGPDRPSH